MTKNELILKFFKKNQFLKVQQLLQLKNDLESKLGQ